MPAIRNVIKSMIQQLVQRCCCLACERHVKHHRQASNLEKDCDDFFQRECQQNRIQNRVRGSVRCLLEDAVVLQKVKTFIQNIFYEDEESVSTLVMANSIF